VPCFDASDGIQIHYETWGRPGLLPPVVLHHGFAASTELNFVLPGIVAALEADDRYVVGVDARGHGRSAKPRQPRCYGEQRMSTDLVELIDLLDLDGYDLVGYSMGAIVAAITAGRDARLRRLVLGGVGAGVVELGGVDTRAVPATALVAALEVEDPTTLADAAEIGIRAMADGCGGDRWALAAQARSVHAEPIALDRITAPTLVLAGRNDPLAVRPEVLVGAIADARLVPVAGDHFGAVIDPMFAAAIVEFLRY
jgi:pimeloyl-ACP methyl ester carboxylesterase